MLCKTAVARTKSLSHPDAASSRKPTHFNAPRRSPCGESPRCCRDQRTERNPVTVVTPTGSASGGKDYLMINSERSAVNGIASQPEDTRSNAEAVMTTTISPEKGRKEGLFQYFVEEREREQLLQRQRGIEWRGDATRTFHPLCRRSPAS